jgi:hypothetical protein
VIEVGDRVRIRRDIPSTYRDMLGTVERVYVIPESEIETAIVALDDLPGAALPFGFTEFARFRTVHDGWTHDCEPCKAKLAARIASGQCAVIPIDDLTQPWLSRCITHNCPDSLAHHFEINRNAFND